MKSLLFLTLLFSLTLFAQREYSVHHEHQLRYGLENNIPARFDGSGAGIIPLRYDKSDSTGAVIFGYLPDWEYQNSKSYLQYDKLTHIAAFDFGVDANGNVSTPAYWPWTDLINEAHSNGVKVILTAVNFKKDQIRNILTDTGAKQKFFDDVLALLNQYQLDGVNVDFESLYSADRGALLNGFMSDLTAFLHSHISDTEVSFAGPSVAWAGWDLAGLAASCDYIFIMGYAFTGSFSDYSGPTSPLTGGNYNLTSTLLSQYGSITANTPEKLILGIPYYGERWLLSSQNPRSLVDSFLNHPRYRDAFPEAVNFGNQWDEVSNTPYYMYPSGSGYGVVWWDNDTSIALKYELARAYNLRGVGMWALGYDRPYEHLWQRIGEYVLSGIEDEQEEPVQYKLDQNYPNPFNPVTTIRFSLPETTPVTLTVSSILGKSRQILSGELYTAGWHEVAFNAEGLPSGIYFYTLSAGNIRLTRKMLLLK